MKITIEKEFATRQDLDKFVFSRFGGDAKENINHEIELTSEEATKLSLSERTTVFGVRVKLKDT